MPCSHSFRSERYGAAREARIDVLQFLRESGCPYDYTACAAAAEEGRGEGGVGGEGRACFIVQNFIILPTRPFRDMGYDTRSRTIIMFHPRLSRVSMNNVLQKKIKINNFHKVHSSGKSFFLTRAMSMYNER